MEKNRLKNGKVILDMNMGSLRTLAMSHVPQEAGESWPSREQKDSKVEELQS